MEKTILFAIAMKRIKYLKISLTKHVKELDTENYKALLEEIEKKKEIERYSVVMDWKNKNS